MKLKSKIIIRGVMLGIASLIILVWNMALSTQRENLSGEFVVVGMENIVLTVNAPGRIEPKIFKTIRSEVDGRKLAVLVQVGEKVKEGQLLMEISDDLIKIEVTQKKTGLQNAKDDMEKARKDLRLEKSLFAQQAVPRRNVENAEESYERAVQKYEIAKQEMNLTAKKAEGIHVKSPMDGVLIKSFVNDKENISSGQELLTVAQMDEFAVKGKVDELYIADIQIGQEARISCDAFPGVDMKGKVSWIGAQAMDGAFAEIEVTVDILDAGGASLKPNLTAETQIVTGKIPGGIVVNAKAVRSGPKGTYVLLKRGGGWLVKRPVKVKQVNSGRAIIQEGLAGGDVVLMGEK